jgi:hypothetical protein
MSLEAEDSHVEKVYQRWNDIDAHLARCLRTLFRLKDHGALLRTLFEECRQKQLPATPAIHLTAFIFNPENIAHALSAAEARNIFEFLEKYAGNSASNLRDQFGQYRSQEGCFSPSVPAWDVKSTPIQFWTEMKPWARELSKFALRLLHTPAN